MKRIVLCLLTLLLLSSCAVKGRGSQPEMPSEVNATVHVAYLNNEYTAGLTVQPNGNINISVEKPDELAGMNVSVDESGCHVDCKGLSLTYSADQFKKLCPFADLYDIFATVKNNAASSVNQKGSEWEFTYTKADGEYKIYVDAKTDMITRIDSGKYIFEMG